MKPTMILFLFLFTASISLAQQGVRLTSRFSKRQKFFAEGSRVFYEYANRNHLMSVSYSRYGHPIYLGIRGKGVLHVVNDSTIQVDQEIIKIKDLILLGPKNKGAWVGSFVLYWGGLAMAIGSVSHDKDTSQTHVDPTLISLGIGCMIGGAIDAFSRFPKPMSDWRVEVVR